MKRFFEPVFEKFPIEGKFSLLQRYLYFFLFWHRIRERYISSRNIRILTSIHKNLPYILSCYESKSCHPCLRESLLLLRHIIFLIQWYLELRIKYLWYHNSRIRKFEAVDGIVKMIEYNIFTWLISFIIDVYIFIYLLSVIWSLQILKIVIYIFIIFCHFVACISNNYLKLGHTLQ